MAACKLSTSVLLLFGSPSLIYAQAGGESESRADNPDLNASGLMPQLFENSDNNLAPILANPSSPAGR